MNRPILQLGFALASACVACSWQRYDEITEDAPVRILEGSGNVHTIGISIGSLGDGKGTPQVFAAGLDGYALFDLNVSGNDPIASFGCERSSGCFMAQRVANLRHLRDAEAVPCVAFAISKATDGPPQVQLHCGTSNLRLALSEEAANRLGTPNAGSALGLSLVSGPRQQPTRLLVSETNSRLVAYFPATSSTGVAIPSPEGATNSFGRSIALLDDRFDGSGPGATLVLGDPEAARVHLYAVDEAGATVTTRCLSVPADFGNLLETGHFASADSEGLAIATPTGLTILPDLKEFWTVAEPASACVPLKKLSKARTIDCQGLGLGAGCTAPFDAGDLAAADLDGDGIDELVAGAPTVAGNGQTSAGAVFTLKLGDTLAVRDQLTPSSSESGDRLGQSVLGVAVDGRDVILAGAPGGNKLAAFYCSTLVPKGEGGKRCR